MSQQHKFLNHPLDITDDFYELENEYFVSGEVKAFDAKKGEGTIQWNYHRWQMDWFFNKIDMHLQKVSQKEAPFQDYESHPVCKFSLAFINSRTIRLRLLMKKGTGLYICLLAVLCVSQAHRTIF